MKGGEPGGKDLSDVHSLVARKLLLGTTFGDLLLCKYQHFLFVTQASYVITNNQALTPFSDLLFRRDIPHRDYAMCRAGLVLLILFTTIESSNERPQLTSKRFRRIFGALSLLEVVFTLAIPWLIILEGLFNTSERAKNGHLLAAHLFIFQVCYISCAHTNFIPSEFIFLVRIDSSQLLHAYLRRKLLAKPS